MRIAVLADVHGNVRALRAVLADIDQNPVDTIVVAGDVAGGPFAREVLELLRARPERVQWIRGNVETSAVAAFDGMSMSDEPPGRGATWTGSALDRNRLVVGGHTHQQFVRRLPSGQVWANAGSVGLPFEGRVGAFWMTVEAGVAEPRQTAYDVTAALQEIRSSGFPNAYSDRWLSLADPVDRDWITALYEHRAGRREAPGEPPGWPSRS
jgi:predicted phosphodiesterase